MGLPSRAAQFNHKKPEPRPVRLEPGRAPQASSGRGAGRRPPASITLIASGEAPVPAWRIAMSTRRRAPVTLSLVACGCLVAAFAALPLVAQSPTARVLVSFPPELSRDAIDGRLLLMFSTNADGEPRFQISDGLDTQQVFGIDVERLAPGRGGDLRRGVLGYPLESLAGHPGRRRTPCRRCCTGTRRSAAPTATSVKLPMDRGEGQQWSRAPGNLYSDAAASVAFDPGRRRSRSRIVARQGHPADPRPADDEVHQARAHPERAADEVLGPAHVPRRARAAARGIRRASRRRATRWSSTTATSRTRSTGSARRRPTRT